jgi:hypothetical protein
MHPSLKEGTIKEQTRNKGGLQWLVDEKVIPAEDVVIPAEDVTQAS